MQVDTLIHITRISALRNAYDIAMIRANRDREPDEESSKSTIRKREARLIAEQIRALMEER